MYRARDTRLDRSAAIKILPAHFSNDPIRKQRFEHEAKSISALNHRNICTLYNVGSQDGVDYIVTECVEGESLAASEMASSIDGGYAGGTFGAGASAPGASDQDSGPNSLDNANPNRYFGPSVLDCTHQISFGGYADLPFGFQFGIIGHFWSPLSTSLVVPNTNLGPGGKFFAPISQAMEQSKIQSLGHTSEISIAGSTGRTSTPQSRTTTTPTPTSRSLPARY